MAVQRLFRFAACEHREVIDAIKRATAAALPRPSVGTAWTCHRGGMRWGGALVWPAVAPRTRCGRTAWWRLQPFADCGGAV